MKDRIRRSFDRARATYRDAAVVQRTAARKLSCLIPSGTYPRILEVGSGGGFLHSFLRQRGVLGTYLALDLSRSMLGMHAKTHDPDLHLMQADGEACPLRPDSIDLLLSSSTLQWFERPDTSIPALLSLLRPGGRLFFSIFVKGTLTELADSSRATGFGSVRPLRPDTFYTELLGHRQGITFSSFVSEETVYLDSVRAVLDHLRDTGVGQTAHKRPSSRATYTAFMDYYESRFGSQGRIPATYRILFLSGIRQEK
jgi:malonyl-CoA O-methyltransferase